MPTVNLQVASGSDDAFEGATGTMNLSASAVGIISTQNQWAGLRFANVTVPKGAAVSSATLQININSTANDTVIADFYGEAADNPGTFTASSGNISGRALTTAKTSVNASDVGAGWYSIDVTAVVQEIVSRGGWASGNAMVLILDATSNSISLQFRAYDDNPSNAAKLDITYTSGSPVTVALDTLSAAVSAVSLAVVPGAVSTLLDTLSAALAVQSLIVVPGGVAVVLTTLELDAGAADLSVVPGETFIVLNTLNGALSAVQLVVTVDGTDVSVVLASLPLVASAVNLDVVPGGVTVDLATLALLLSAVGVEISTEVLPQIIALSTLALAAETPSLAVVPGEVAIELQSLAMNLTLVDLTVFLMLGCALAADRRRYGAIAADGLRWYATASDRDGCC